MPSISAISIVRHAFDVSHFQDPALKGLQGPQQSVQVQPRWYSFEVLIFGGEVHRQSVLDGSV